MCRLYIYMVGARNEYEDACLHACMHVTCDVSELKLSRPLSMVTFVTFPPITMFMLIDDFGDNPRIT